MWIHSGNIARQDVDVIREVWHGDGYRTQELPTTGEDELVIDIGAHIGTFAWMWRRRNPNARIVCVEANPDNWEVLAANCGDWATVKRGACAYDRSFQLMNSICPEGVATGGSFLAPFGFATPDTRYRVDQRQIPAFTLEELCDGETIHLLKLDCEGSEFQILAGTSLLPKTRLVVGEYHGREHWERERGNWFGPQWRYTLLRDGEIGGFLYENREL